MTPLVVVAHPDEDEGRRRDLDPRAAQKLGRVGHGQTWTTTGMMTGFVPVCFWM